MVDVVHDGKVGYEHALSGIYDLMILDVMLPGMSGYEVLARMRAEGQELPVLILSARTELEDKIQGFQSGASNGVYRLCAFPCEEGRNG